MKNLLHNNRGIALLIVLLVTALLIALVFEFAYGTRVSLRAAMNYRDSQRAHYLARSGVGYVWWNLVNMPGNLAHREWQVVPIVSTGDTEVRVRWEDEGGKINIAEVKEGNSAHKKLESLFTILEIDQDILDVMSDENHQTFGLITELHEIMPDDQFRKIEKLLTVKSKLAGKVNINTAPLGVLESVLVTLEKNKNFAEDIKNRREKETISEADQIKDIIESVVNASNNFDFSNYSNVSRVYSYTTVGEYVTQIETIIDWNREGFTIKYWRTL